jgi:hypothetical protein
MFTTPSVTKEGAAAALSRSRPSRKRKQVSYNYEDSDADEPTLDEQYPPKKAKTLEDDKTAIALSKPTKSPKKKSKAESDSKSQDEEKRLRRFRARAPQSFLEVKGRALTQRLTVLDRERCGTDEVPEEKVVMAGSTGNVYTQHICQVPSCDCPHAKKGNQCKHIVYIMLRVLRAPESVGYQLALTSQELRDLFKNAAPIPSANAEDTAATQEDGNRKSIEGECPICYTDFEPEGEAIVYCKAGCGNNVHKDCMQKWMAAKSGKATCPYCRTKWAEEDVGALGGKVNLEGAMRTEDGYVNVAGQLGLSGERDYSTYHPYWVRQQRQYTGYGSGGRRRRR